MPSIRQLRERAIEKMQSPGGARWARLAVVLGRVLIKSVGEIQAQMCRLMSALDQLANGYEVRANVYQLVGVFFGHFNPSKSL